MKVQRISTNTKIAEWNSKMAYEYRVLERQNEKFRTALYIVGMTALVIGALVGRFVI